jgi:hypothetical protein
MRTCESERAVSSSGQSPCWLNHREMLCQTGLQPSKASALCLNRDDTVLPQTPSMRLTRWLDAHACNLTADLLAGYYGNCKDDDVKAAQRDEEPQLPVTKRKRRRQAGRSGQIGRATTIQDNNKLARHQPGQRRVRAFCRSHQFQLEMQPNAQQRSAEPAAGHQAMSHLARTQMRIQMTQKMHHPRRRLSTKH